MSLIIDGIRFIVWVIAKVFLIVSDWLYEALEMIVKLDLSNSKAMRYTWLFFLGFLSFACIVRISMVVFKKMSDPESDFDLIDLPKKIFYVFLAVTLSTTGFFFALGVPGQVYKIYSETVRYDDRLIPSTAVLSSTALTPLSSDLEDMIATEETVDIEKIDDDLNMENNEGDYIYFTGTSELILCVAGGLIVMFLQLNIVTDTGTRLFLNVFRFVIGFIPISSIIESDNTFSEWCRDIVSDTFVIAFDIIAMQLVFGVMTFNSILKLNGIVRIIIFAVGLLAIGKIGSIIARYLKASELSGGGHAGSMLLGMTAFQTMRSGGRVMGNIVKSAGGGLMKAGGYAVGKAQAGYGNMKDYMTNKKNSQPLGSSGSASADKTSSLGYNAQTGEVVGGTRDLSDSSLRYGGSVYAGGDGVLDINPMSSMAQSTYMIGATKMRLAFAGARMGSQVLSNTMGKSYRESQRHVEKSKGKDDVRYSRTKHSEEARKNLGEVKNIRDKKPIQKTGTTFIEGKTRGHLYRGSERKSATKVREKLEARSMSNIKERKTNSELNRDKKRGDNK